MKKRTEKITTTNPTEIEGLISRIEAGQLKKSDIELIVRLLRLVLEMAREAEKPTEPKNPGGAKPTGEGEASNDNDIEAGDSPEEGSGKQETPEPKPGHGRIGADRYRVREIVRCENPDLHPGDGCPHQGCSGRLYDTNDPQVLIQLEGQPVIEATRYEQQVLRCSACQGRFAARLPEGVSPVKYDATADATIAVMKYGAGMPWNRMSRLQELMDVPLPTSTQFERCEAVADVAHPVYLELERLAAAGEIFHADDTGVKILAFLKENKKLPDGERKGLHTTGIGSLFGKHRVALYYSGRRHAGENLAELVRKRPPQLPTPIVMADAEAKNWVTGFEQIVAKCLQHGRRKFKEIETDFSIECRRVLDDLRAVYRFEAQTREMTPTQRLLYHQSNSKRIMDELRDWIQMQFDNREVEPNSRLGAAMSYMLKHWNGLTCFLKIEGAPLDNNLVERMLKRAVLHRKNALFFKTSYGARIGDILLSLIETCALNKVNPFSYLVTLIRNPAEVRRNPARWLPWSFQEDMQPA